VAFGKRDLAPFLAADTLKLKLWHGVQRNQVWFLWPL